MAAPWPAPTSRFSRGAPSKATSWTQTRTRWPAPTSTRGRRISAARAGDSPQPYGRTQSDGHFILRGVEDYPHTVNVSAGGFGATSEQNIRQGEADLQLTVVKLGWIVGVVEGMDGTPLRGTFLIHVTRKRNNNNSRRNRWRGGNTSRRSIRTTGRSRCGGVKRASTRSERARATG